MGYWNTVLYCTTVFPTFEASRRVCSVPLSHCLLYQPLTSDDNNIGKSAQTTKARTRGDLVLVAPSGLVNEDEDEEVVTLRDNLS